MRPRPSLFKLRCSGLLTLLVLLVLGTTGCSVENPTVPADDISADKAADPMVPFRGEYTTSLEFGPFGPDSFILNITAEGTATHLGRNTWFAASEVTYAGQQTAAGSFLSASGDELSWEGGGVVSTLEDGTRVFSGEWTVTGGTGRFDGATGGGSYEGSAMETAGQIAFTGEVSRPGRNR